MTYDWHDSECGRGDDPGCGCGMPAMFRSAFDDGLTEAKRRLSVAEMHDGKCPEPSEPCTCGLAAAIDNPSYARGWNDADLTAYRNGYMAGFEEAKRASGPKR